MKSQSMGLRIANGAVMADADKAFIKLNSDAETIALTQNNQDSTVEENNTATILEKLHQLTQIVNELKVQVKSLSDDNIKLRARMNPSTTDIPSSTNSLPTEQSQSDTSLLEPESPATGESDSEGFIYDKVQKRKRLRRKRRSERDTEKTSKNGSTQITKVEGKSESIASTDLWVGGVHPSCTVEELLSHLTSVGVDNASATWLATSNRGSSYKVGVPSQYYHTSLSNDTWPEGIICRPFRPKHSTKSGFRASETQQKPQRGNNQNPRHTFRDQRQHVRGQRQPFRGQTYQPRPQFNRQKHRAFNQGHHDRTTGTHNTQQSFRIPQNITQNTQSYQSMWPPLPSKPQQNWWPPISQPHHAPWYPAVNTMYTI